MNSKVLCVLQDKAVADQAAYHVSWRKYPKDMADAGVKYVGGKIWENADYYGRLAGAWRLNHFAVDTLEQVTANVIYGVANLAYGPAVGARAYYTAKGVWKTLGFTVPGFEGYLAGIDTPATKTLVVDPVINYGRSLF